MDGWTDSGGGPDGQACTPEGLRLIDTVPGLGHAELERLIGLPLLADGANA